MKLPEIKIEAVLRTVVPEILLGVIICRVDDSPHNEELWQLIEASSDEIRGECKMEEIKHLTTIHATRKAYKACGKDPNRYRPSAEQLRRRVVQGKALYRISTLVDLINFISLKTGYSIGGFDLDKTKGNLSYGVGRPDEAYVGIGRGILNIEGLPVLRDEFGAVGTPTSDEERTSLSNTTSHLLMNINAFDGNRQMLEKNIFWAIELLKTYVNAKVLSVRLCDGFLTTHLTVFR